MARRSSKARRHPKAKPQGILELNAQGFGFVKTAEGEFFIPASRSTVRFPATLLRFRVFLGNLPTGITLRLPANLPLVLRVLLCVHAYPYWSL